MKGVFILSDRLAQNTSYFPGAVREALEASGVETALIGKAATVARDEDREDSHAAFGAGPWLLHSPETQLATYLLSGPQRFNEIYLFHNFKRRLEKFSRNLTNAGFAGTVRAL
jgi:hypothetical protein